MATFWERITGRVETRDYAAPSAPPRSNSQYVSGDKALTLTAVYRAIQILATPISKMQITTWRYATGMEMKIENPLFINRPSLDQNRRETLFESVTSLAMFGESFWFKERNAAGTVISIQVLPATDVYPRLEDNGRKVFDYKGKTYTSDSIEHLKLFTQAGVLRGLGPIQTCSKDISGALDLREYASNWFSQSGVPTGLLKSAQMLNEEQAEKTRQSWLKAQRERTVAVLGNNTDYQSVALSPKDALFTEVQNQSVQQVARMFGIPARLLLTGVDGTSDTYTNLQDENQVFYRHTLTAYTDAITDALSNCLPRGTRTQFEFEDLFKSDISARYNYYKVGVDGGWLTPAIVQAKEGLNG
jgi:HK97 family phage portal protein